MARIAAIRSANQGWRAAPQLRVELARHGGLLILDPGHVADGLLDGDRQVAGRRRGAGGHRLGGREQGLVVDAAQHQAEPLGFGTVEHLAEEHRSGRRLGADDAAHHPGVPPARVDAELQEAGVEARPPGGQSHVATERQVHPGPDRRPVDRGERRQRAAGDAQEPLVDRAQAAGIALLPGCRGWRRHRTRAAHR